jgi:hypothetical protein
MDGKAHFSSLNLQNFSDREMTDRGRKTRSDDLSHYMSLVDAYEKAPTMANYVRLKRTGGPAVIGRFADFDPLTIEAELRRYGIDPLMVCSALEGDEREIEKLSVRLMECLIERDQIEKEGHTHVQGRQIAISDSLVDFLTVAMLEAVAEENHTAMVVLIRERLCGQNPDYYKDFLVFTKQRKAVALAALRFPTGKISVRKVAKLMNVEPSTVSRWFPAGALQEQVDKFRKSVGALGLREKRAKSGKKSDKS